MKRNPFGLLRFPLVAIIAFSLVKCGGDKAAPAPAPEDPIAVSTGPVVTGNFSRKLQYSGQLASNSEARLSFKLGGIISGIYVKEGDRVSAGQLLASLDLTEIDAQVRQAEQNLEKAKRDESRISHLYQDTVASLEQLQNTNTQVSVATEALKIARFNRQYAQIRAGSDGVILQKILNEGEYATSGSAVLLLNEAGANDWVVRFGVSDKDWTMLKKGDRADIEIDAYPGEQFSGTITKMTEGADAASGTYPIEVKVQPSGHKFATGLFCTVHLQPPSTRTVSLIPAEALAEGDGTTGYVYSLNPDKRTVRKNRVHIAWLQDNQIAVSSGLENISEVITRGSGYLTEKSIVKPN
jgi:RND family efflux transporter MFP subunit